MAVGSRKVGVGALMAIRNGRQLAAPVLFSIRSVPTSSRHRPKRSPFKGCFGCPAGIPTPHWMRHIFRRATNQRKK
jgi:hypothetical protein